MQYFEYKNRDKLEFLKKHAMVDVKGMSLKNKIKNSNNNNN